MTGSVMCTSPTLHHSTHPVINFSSCHTCVSLLTSACARACETHMVWHSALVLPHQQQPSPAFSRYSGLPARVIGMFARWRCRINALLGQNSRCRLFAFHDKMWSGENQCSCLSVLSPVIAPPSSAKQRSDDLLPRLNTARMRTAMGRTHSTDNTPASC